MGMYRDSCCYQGARSKLLAKNKKEREKLFDDVKIRTSSEQTEAHANANGIVAID